MLKQIREDLLLSTYQHHITTLSGLKNTSKTRLTRKLFPTYRYISLKNPKFLILLERDPKKFFSLFDSNIILDDCQCCLDIVKRIQQYGQGDKMAGQWILISDRKIEMPDDAENHNPIDIKNLHTYPAMIHDLIDKGQGDSDRLQLYGGFSAPLFSDSVSPNRFFKKMSDAILLDIGPEKMTAKKKKQWHTLLQTLATLNGVPLNASVIGKRCGISHTSIFKWIKLLEAFHVIKLVPAYQELSLESGVKTPKVLFTDTGLLCHLLDIRSAEDLATSVHRQAVFESFLIGEFFKQKALHHLPHNAYYVQDYQSHDIPLVLAHDKQLTAIALHCETEVPGKKQESLSYFIRKKRIKASACKVIYGGDHYTETQGIATYPWDSDQVFKGIL